MNKFVFPQSVQSDFFNYLKPEQQEFLKPILRVLKKPAQIELCCSLLDYMETGEIVPPHDFTLSALFFFVTRTRGEASGAPVEPIQDNPDDSRFIRPLHVSKPGTCGEPCRTIGTIIKGLLPNL